MKAFQGFRNLIVVDFMGYMSDMSW